MGEMFRMNLHTRVIKTNLIGIPGVSPEMRNIRERAFGLNEISQQKVLDISKYRAI